MRRWAGLAFKLVATATLFWLLLQDVNVEQLSGLLSGVRWGWLVGATGVVALMLTSHSLFMVAALFRLGYRMRLTASLTYTMVALFFSNVAPGLFGGDVFRAAQMRQIGVPVDRTIRLLIATRLMTLTSLVLVIAAGLPAALSHVVVLEEQTLLVGVPSAVALMLAGLYFVDRLPLRLAALGQVGRDYSTVVVAGSGALSTWGWSTLTHLLRVLVFGALSRALSLEISLEVLFAFVPISLLIAMVPISFASWGLREAAFVFFLARAGVAPESALALSVAFGLLRLAIGVLGGLLWLVSRQSHYAIEV